MDTPTDLVCVICMCAPGAPFRRQAIDGSYRIREGCVAAAHDGHLYGNSLAWHLRPEARACRAAIKKSWPKAAVVRPSNGREKKT